MKNLYLTIIVVLLCTAQSYSQESLNRININKIKTFSIILSSDSLRGRKTGDVGNYIAAQLIERKLFKFKLKKIKDKSYFLKVPIHSSIATRNSELILYTPRYKKKLKYKTDYLIDESGEQTIIPKPYPLVFVGFGIDAPEYNYNDYYYLDVNGKVVVFLSGEPESDDTTYFNGDIPTLYSYPSVKHKIAISKGARGSILIHLRNDKYLSLWEKLVREYSTDYMTLACSFIGNLNLIFNQNSARWLFVGSDFNLTDILELKREKKMESFPLETKISFKEDFIQKDFISHNVLGLIEGTGINKDEYVLVTAHYDHLGIGESVDGDSIYNGFLDNALGVAAVLEIARVLNLNKDKLNRSVLFLFVTGEEFGLLGSKYFLYNPPVELNKIIANVNVDGVAVIDNFTTIVGIGSEYSTLGKILKETAKSLNLGIASVPDEFKYWESFHRSDQSAFAQAGIPSILIAEGLDYVNYPREEGIKKYIEYMNYYHTPFDDANLIINYSAVHQYVMVLLNYIINVANSKNRPDWYPKAEFKK